MKILVTGATGYIGTRLIHQLLKEGHEVIALVRDEKRYKAPSEKVIVVEGDFGRKTVQFPDDIDAAYYLLHSMTLSPSQFEAEEMNVVTNFLSSIKKTSCEQIIYLSGLYTENDLSPHMASRKKVGELLKTSHIPLTMLRAGVIIGSGSASFEIMRDLVEKLPIMVAPKWIAQKCQPISIKDILFYLVSVLKHTKCLDKTFDVGGPDVLTYKDMLYEYAKFRHLHRVIIHLPLLTPKLSSYWLLLITTVNYNIARSLIESVHNNAVCKNTDIHEIFPRQCLTFNESVALAMEKIEHTDVLSTWRSAWTNTRLSPKSTDYVTVPKNGCFISHSEIANPHPPEALFDYILEIAGKDDWYYMDWAWRWRGYIDRIFGGVGLRRNMTHKKDLQVGSPLDFWRILLIEDNRLLLYAEMKIPGEAWLEINVNQALNITATFRPKGLFGRLYWWIFYPVHLVLFPGMCRHFMKKFELHREK